MPEAVQIETVIAGEHPHYYDSNIYRLVNQLETESSEKRIPDAILYINGLPLD
jgi:type I restriction enzyme R subunit